MQPRPEDAMLTLPAITSRASRPLRRSLAAPVVAGVMLVAAWLSFAAFVAVERNPAPADAFAALAARLTAAADPSG
jgi:hypothetical protein